ncbi:hypothetical protein FOL47_004969 [Perkinsus chesapeaki]|uniref:Uncharacterized protein n=1 Tax=Perkinsus chesapeaki TaxID=330153 RepID=A0A7J6MYT8_PERCH|nr:hypothetical protein FOL47_004969 [Perkinsus chesapeaki]
MLHLPQNAGRQPYQLKTAQSYLPNLNPQKLLIDLSNRHGVVDPSTPVRMAKPVTNVLGGSKKPSGQQLVAPPIVSVEEDLPTIPEDTSTDYSVPIPKFYSRFLQTTGTEDLVNEINRRLRKISVGIIRTDPSLQKVSSKEYMDILALCEQAYLLEGEVDCANLLRDVLYDLIDARKNGTRFRIGSTIVRGRHANINEEALLSYIKEHEGGTVHGSRNVTPCNHLDRLLISALGFPLRFDEGSGRLIENSRLPMKIDKRMIRALSASCGQ